MFPRTVEKRHVEPKNIIPQKSMTNAHLYIIVTHHWLIPVLVNSAVVCIFNMMKM
jgi:hypothetical protein